MKSERGGDDTSGIGFFLALVLLVVVAALAIVVSAVVMVVSAVVSA
jgi:hypothetical protein